MVKVGAIVGMIGSTVFMIVGLFTISMARLYYTPPGFPIFINYITGITTLAISACGIVGSVLAFRNINTAGYTILLIAGIAGIVGTFIPIYVYDDGWGYLQFYFLCGTALYGDLVLMLVGGILGFALPEKNKRKDY
jgi:hypothetical protein